MGHLPGCHVRHRSRVHRPPTSTPRSSRRPPARPPPTPKSVPRPSTALRNRASPRPSPRRQLSQSHFPPLPPPAASVKGRSVAANRGSGYRTPTSPAAHRGSGAEPSTLRREHEAARPDWHFGPPILARSPPGLLPRPGVDIRPGDDREPDLQPAGRRSRRHRHRLAGPGPDRLAARGRCQRKQNLQ